MRAVVLLLSLAIHCGAVAGAIVAGLGRPAAAVAGTPRVELLAEPPSPGAAGAEPVPVPVVVEEVAIEVRASAPLEEAVPELLPPAAVPPELAAAPPAERDDVPWLARYRPVPQLASPPALPVPPPPSAASAVVDAKPDADNPPPEYPADDRIRGHEGTVVVAVDLDARGVVLVAALATPSPFPGLNRAALRAVRAWRFEPARAHGVAVPGRLEIPIVFRLTDG